MLSTAIIAFREFLEAFLIIGVFLGISRTLHFKKELEIWMASVTGIVLSLILACGTYYYGDRARSVFSETNADILQSYLLIFSGLFIAYVVFSLHDVVRKGRGGSLLLAHKKMQQRAFDITLFFTIVFLVFREGFEVALFTASAALFATFVQNMTGLVVGFIGSTILGLSVCFAFVKVPLGKIFKATEYIIILLGAALTQNGLTLLLDTQFHLSLSDVFSLHFERLPGENTLVGHLLQGFFGVDQHFSVGRLVIMLVYVWSVYLLFFRKRRPVVSEAPVLD